MSIGAVAAIDLGATSGRVVLGRVGPDTLETTQVARFPNGPIALADGLHWNVVGLYQAALGGLRDAFRAEPSIASIGIDSWGVDYGLIRGNTLLGEPFHYRDARTALGIERVEAVLPHAQLFRRNGLQFLSINTIYQITTEDPALLGVADSALLIPDLIAFLLTGERVGERSNASTTGLLDPATREWHPEVLSRLGLPARLFPRLVSAGERIGAVRAEVAASFGIPAGSR